MLQSQIPLRFADKACIRVSVKAQREIDGGYLLLLSRASPLPCREVHGPVGSSIPVTLLRVTIRERRVLLGRASSSKI